MSVPSIFRVLIESIISMSFLIVSFSLIVYGFHKKYYHTVIWSWFSGFCALKLNLLHLSYLRGKIHDKFDSQQFIKVKLLSLYLLLGASIAFLYYLSMILLYKNGKQSNIF